MGRDVNFDGIATAFEDAIYGSAKGHVRLYVLWEDMLATVPQLADGGLSVLDAGGGAGRMAVRLAELGNDVLLCDPSREMLGRAEALVGDAGLGDSVTTKHAGIRELATTLDRPFDVITCHAVLEWLAEPKDAVGELSGLLKPGGFLSLMFYNRTAALMNRVLTGAFAAALREQRLGPAREGWGEGAMPLAEETVREWLIELGLRVRSKAGIRIFFDHIPPAALGPDKLDELLAVERALRQVEPFASLGQHVHFVAQAPS